MYAGTANATKCIRYANYRGVKFDILYSTCGEDGNRHKSDYMNILHSSGFLCLNLNYSYTHWLFPWMPCCISNPTFSACPAQSQVVLHLCPEGKVQPGICDPAGNKMQHICCSESRHIRKECMCSNWINWTFERSTSQSNGRKDCGSNKRSIKKSVVYMWSI